MSISFGGCADSEVGRHKLVGLEYISKCSALVLGSTWLVPLGVALVETHCPQFNWSALNQLRQHNIKLRNPNHPAKRPVSNLGVRMDGLSRISILYAYNRRCPKML
jgi:hypothetical protein